MIPSSSVVGGSAEPAAVAINYALGVIGSVGVMLGTAAIFAVYLDKEPSLDGSSAFCSLAIPLLFGVFPILVATLFSKHCSKHSQLN